jgi:hypothetical protein
MKRAFLRLAGATLYSIPTTFYHYLQLPSFPWLLFIA